MEKSDVKYYNKGYYAGYRAATIDHLGGVCSDCGKDHNLEIHHIIPLDRKARSLKDLADLTKLKLKCKDDHKDNNSYKRAIPF